MNPADVFVKAAGGEISFPFKLAVLDKNGKLIAEFKTMGACEQFVRDLVVIGQKLVARKKKEGL